MLRASLAAVVALAPCLWDRDTLAVEANGAPEMVHVLTGRFDRFPPEYYEVRLARVTAELGEAKRDLALLDDAAVACDRLGRSGDAIAWMAHKRAALDALETPDAHHEYTYLANLGTFHVHRWLTSGRDRGDLADVERSRDLIRAAIELNPDAHFGRERYQLLAIESLLAPRAVEDGRGYPSLLTWAFGREPHRFEKEELEAAGLGDAATGIAGLVHLGNAWEATSIWIALEQALHAQEDAFLARLAALRVVELIDARPATAPAGFDCAAYLHEGRALVKNKQLRKVDAWYVEARAAAERWRAHRNAFLLARLAEGKHPDTHPDFWSGWRPRHPSPPVKGR